MAQPAAPGKTTRLSAAGVAHTIRTLLAWLALCHERHRQRRALRQLDDDLLKDIGITRAAARAEAGKPWWR